MLVLLCAARKLGRAPCPNTTKWQPSSIGTRQNPEQPKVRGKRSKEINVHTTQLRHRSIDDDRLSHLLGFVGQYLQGCKKLPVRTVLLGLRRGDFCHVSDPGADHGLDRQ